MTDRHPLLSIRGLEVSFGSAPPVVKGIDLDVRRGQVMGLVGESGSGKSVTARAVMGLLRPPGQVTAGTIHFDGTDLLTLGRREMQRTRGARLAMVFQDPLSALNPAMTVGAQVMETLRAHGTGRRSARARTVELFERVGIPAAAERLDDFPHQFSGGMRQRVVIATAIANNPDLLIADEPTTALDVTVQAQILELLRELTADLGMATLLITHDFGVVAELCDDVSVMLRGDVVERAQVERVLTTPEHDYTRRLIAAVPSIEDAPPVRQQVAEAAPALAVRDLVVDLAAGRNLVGRRSSPVLAVNGVSLEIRPGETLGLVGESGCGKSTLSRAIAGLLPVSSGTVAVGGHEVTRLGVGHPRRRAVQYIFQDPFGSLNPLRTVGQSLREALDSTTADGPSEIDLVLRVGLDPTFLDRYPSALSGGQRQRVGIARALAAQPAVVLSDEPVSALDVSVQAQIIELLGSLRESGVANLFVAHDLGVVKHISDRVAVMFLGRIVEIGPVAEIYGNPSHPYTRALLSASPVPRLDPGRQRIVLAGDPPSLRRQPTGCAFASRCPVGPQHRDDRARCLEEAPVLHGAGAHAVACHFSQTADLPAPSRAS